jgi:hypothetical protein
MKKFAFIVISAALLAATVAAPAFAQQEKGDVELGLNGDVLFSHSSPLYSHGDVFVDLGYYVTSKNLVGISSETQIDHVNGSTGVSASTNTSESIYGHYRHLFSLKAHPVLFPYVGAYAGGNYDNQGTTSSDKKFLFAGQGEGGIKYFMSKKAAFEVAYNLLYVNYPNSNFQNRSFSDITFGLTYDFGKKKK